MEPAVKVSSETFETEISEVPALTSKVALESTKLPIVKFAEFAPELTAEIVVAEKAVSSVRSTPLITTVVLPRTSVDVLAGIKPLKKLSPFTALREAPLSPE